MIIYYCVPMYHKNEKSNFIAKIHCLFLLSLKIFRLRYFWCKFIACSSLVLMKYKRTIAIIMMKTFLTQIYSLFLFGFDEI